MQKPSPQFIRKLESELRMAYRAEHQGRQLPVPKPFGGIFRFLLPAFSGALVLAIVFMNYIGNPSTTLPDSQNPTQAGAADAGGNGEDRLITFNEGEEEQVVQGFDNEELNQIDNGVKLVAAGNY